MSVGQFEVKFADEATVKVNCANISHAVFIATAMKPALEIISVVKRA